MAKNPKKSQQTLSRKHQDRMHREQKQTRLILAGAIAVIAVVVLLILYGYLDQKYFRFMRPVALVNGEKVTVNEFRDFTKYYRNNLIQSAEYTFQLASMFASDQSSLQSFGSQLLQIADELDAERAGNQALDQLIDDKIIRQEAEKRGISVSPDEIEKSMQEALRYYADGTPTPEATLADFSTPTLSPEQMAMIPPTATSIPTETAAPEVAETGTVPNETPEGEVLEPTATMTVEDLSTPTLQPTATEYTLDGYQNSYATMVANLATVEVSEEILRYVIESRLIQEQLKEEIIGEIPCVEEQVRAQHILVDNEQLAKDIQTRALGGEDWFALAAEFSIDESNKNQGGDLGWFGKGQMVAEFENAALALDEPGQISEPVNTQFGWHVIRLVGKQEVPITATQCSTLADEKFQEWVTQIREDGDVVIKDEWVEFVPLLPVLPEDIQVAVDGMRSSQTQPVGVPTPSP